MTFPLFYDLSKFHSIKNEMNDNCNEVNVDLDRDCVTLRGITHITSHSDSDILTTIFET